MQQFKTSPWASSYNIGSFLENLEEIRAHNSILAGYSKGLNMFTGVNKKEVLKSMGGGSQEGEQLGGKAYTCP
jgi:hypothetical protein